MQAEQAASHEAAEISREEIQRRLHDRSLLVVDALSAESYAAGHLPGARSLPLADIPTRAAAVLPNRAAETAVYCAKFT